MNETPCKKAARRPRVEERDPLLAAKAIERYAETGSLNATSKSTGLPRSTVKAILTRRSDDFDTVKKVVAERAAVLAETCLERAQQCADRLTPYQALVGAKISTDHMLLALGERGGLNVNIDLAGAVEAARRAHERQRQMKELGIKIDALKAQLGQNSKPPAVVVDVPESAAQDGGQEEAKTLAAGSESAEAQA